MSQPPPPEIADRIYNLTLSDGFHRNRRTLLIFAAAALAVSVATPSASRALPMPWVAVQIDQYVAWALLWSAAVYYAVGFGVDAVTAWRQISDFALQHSKDGIDAAIDAFGRRLIREAQKIDEAIGGAPRYTGSPPIRTADDIVQDALDQLIEKAAKMPASTTGLVVTPRQLELAKEEIVGMIVSRLQTPLSQLSANLEKQHAYWDKKEQHLRRVDAARESGLKYLASIKFRLDTISRRIVWERRWSFILWEVASPFTFLLIVTIVGWPEFTWAVARCAEWSVNALAFATLLAHVGWLL